MNFYKTNRWHKKREVILKRDNYLCKECSRYNKTTLADTVHHIYPMQQYPKLRMVNDNLVSLCNKCHETMHDRTNGLLTDKGLAWVRRCKIVIEMEE